MYVKATRTHSPSSVLRHVGMEQGGLRVLRTKKHLSAYQARWNTAKEKSTEMRQKYQSESNQLDRTDFDSKDYRILDMQCERTRINYKKVQAKAEECYAKLKLEEEYCAQMHSFEIQSLRHWASRMMKIINAVRTEAKRTPKERNA